MNAAQIKAKLLTLVGQTVEIASFSYDDQSPEQFYFRVTGKLERDEDYPDSFFVRVKEDALGVSGVNFTVGHVGNLETLTYSNRIYIARQHAR